MPWRIGARADHRSLRTTRGTGLAVAQQAAVAQFEEAFGGDVPSASTTFRWLG
jgi:hypothetical protein